MQLLVAGGHLRYIIIINIFPQYPHKLFPYLHHLHCCRTPKLSSITLSVRSLLQLKLTIARCVTLASTTTDQQLNASKPFFYQQLNEQAILVHPCPHISEMIFFVADAACSPDSPQQLREAGPCPD